MSPNLASPTKDPKSQAERTVVDRTVSTTVDFLRHALENGPIGVLELEAKAPEAGLLGKRQSITHAKRFIRAKKILEIRSVRNRFGAAGEWTWLSPPEPAAPAAEPIPAPENESDRLFADLQGWNIPKDWLFGIARLDYDQSPTTDIPLHRWRRFFDDSHLFVRSPENGAARAAELGWGALSLFGCCRARPLELCSAGLVWAICGGKLTELRRDWATIERAADRSRHIHHRRLDATNVTLPWIGLRRREAG
jgi:hypothetical protein